MENPKQVKHITTRNLNEESIIIDLHEKRMFHQLNPVGSFIWKKCDGKHTLDEICHQLTQEFNIDLQTAQKDVDEFVNQLQERSLLT